MSGTEVIQVNDPRRRETKFCPQCQENKPVSEFYKNKSKSDGLQSYCKGCKKAVDANHRLKRPEYQSQYVAKNREKIAEQQRAYRDANKENLRVASKLYRQANAEILRQKHREKYLRTRVRVLDRVASYRAQNREVINEKNREYVRRTRAERSAYGKEYRARPGIKERRAQTWRTWKARNPERAKAIGERYRSLKAQAEGDFTYDEWLLLCSLYDYACLRCRINLPLTIDHVIPLSKGGDNWITNIQPLCKRCNSAKNSRTEDYRDGRERPYFAQRPSASSDSSRVGVDLGIAFR